MFHPPSSAKNIFRRSILAGFCMGVAFSSTLDGAAVRIMPLGDSITQGTWKETCFRLYLDSLLDEAAYEFDFVGSLTGPGSGYDSDHEGHWGWEADRILSQVGGYARSARPDIVLVHLGTNDILHETYDEPMVVVNRTINELGAIIDALQNENPSVTVFLAQLIPDTYSFDRASIDSLNHRIPSLASAKSTAASPVIVVDQNTGFDYAADLVDPWHPNESGARKMAGKWFAALQAYFDSPTSIAPRVAQSREAGTAAPKAARRLFGVRGNPADHASSPAGVFDLTGRHNPARSLRPQGGIGFRIVARVPAAE